MYKVYLHQGQADALRKYLGGLPSCVVVLPDLPIPPEIPWNNRYFRRHPEKYSPGKNASNMNKNNHTKNLELGRK